MDRCGSTAGRQAATRILRRPGRRGDLGTGASRRRSSRARLAGWRRRTAAPARRIRRGALGARVRSHRLHRHLARMDPDAGMVVVLLTNRVHPAVSDIYIRRGRAHGAGDGSRPVSDLCMGMISGTSVDGIDVALVEIAGHGRGATIRTIGFETVAYPLRFAASCWRSMTTSAPPLPGCARSNVSSASASRARRWRPARGSASIRPRCA